MSPAGFETPPEKLYTCHNARQKGSAVKISKTKTKVRRIGNSLGIVLSKELLDRLNVREGDELFWVVTPDGVRLTPDDPDFEAVARSNRNTMDRHRNALEDLAE